VGVWVGEWVGVCVGVWVGEWVGVRGKGQKSTLSPPGSPPPGSPPLEDIDISASSPKGKRACFGRLRVIFTGYASAKECNTSE
jgi:hypothetical protein